MKTPRRKVTAEELFEEACRLAHEASRSKLRKRRVLYDALSRILALYDYDRQSEVEALLRKHHVRARKDSDQITRLVRLIFPQDARQLRNWYASALRRAKRYGITADQLSGFLAEYGGVEKVARAEHASARRSSDATKLS
jgi:hypothetical protein